MPLDLGAVTRRIGEVADAVIRSRRPDLLARARDLLRTADPERLRALLRNRPRRFPWLVAFPTDTLAGRFVPPVAPADFSVAAADGSSIAPSRHNPVAYYVLNTSQVLLTYGRTPAASLQSRARFCCQHEELFLRTSAGERPMDANLLGAEMSVAELEAVADTALAAPRPCLALRDGSLILWTLQSADKTLQEFFLSRFLAQLERFKVNEVPLVSYVSMTNSRDLCNALRVLLCPGEPGQCDACSTERDERALCDFLGGLRDRHLLDGVLQPGERTDLFESQSDILKNYGGHRVQFCYLDVGGEIARLEMPEWMAGQPELVALAHALVLDQCSRSADFPPYPPVLSEAHEKAVIDASDRELVERLIERELAAQGIPYVRSAKDRAKRRRGA